MAEVKVKEGQSVNKGDLLVWLDDEETILELRAAEIRLDNARRDYERLKALHADGGIGANELRQAENAAKLAEIDVERWKLRLDRTRLISPRDGTVSVSVSPGQKVSAGETVVYIVTPGEGPTSRPTRSQAGRVPGPRR